MVAPASLQKMLEPAKKEKTIYMLSNVNRTVSLLFRKNTEGVSFRDFLLEAFAENASLLHQPSTIHTLFPSLSSTEVQMEFQSQETSSSKFEAIVDDILATKAAQLNDIQEQDDDTEEPIFKTRGRASAKNLRKRKREDENASKPEDEVDPEVLYAEFFALLDSLAHPAF